LLTVEKIEKIGKLELVRISIKDVIEQTNKRPFYLPNAQAVLIVAGKVLAGIDLQKVSKEDVNNMGEKIIIKLPKPEIILSKVDHKKSKVYNVKWGGFSTAQLVDEAYKAAEQKIIEEATNMGYEEICKNNAKAVLLPLFREISHKQVEISFKE